MVGFEPAVSSLTKSILTRIMIQSTLCLQCYGSIPNGRKFCSRHCSNSHNNKLKPHRKPEGSCRICSAPIRTVKTFCSDACKVVSKQRSKEAKRLKNSQHVVVYRQRVKRKAVQYKGGKCQGCGYDKCIRALTFHHIDSKQKDFNISSSTVSWETIRKELDKCILLCANCHAEVHDGVRSLAVGVGLEPTMGVAPLD